MNKQIRSLIDNVQTNCHISDARHASDYTLCIYLLKMREFYRWEKSLGYDDELDSNDIGNWLTAREALWDELEPEDFLPLSVGEHTYSSFEAGKINNSLLNQGYIYSAGYGPNAKPVFFMADLQEKIIQNDFNIYISGHEHARDLTAPVAMSQQNNIFIRRESLRRMIWEKTIEWGWHQNKNAMFKAMNFYEFASEPDSALDEMTNKELNNVILHEIGEINTAQELHNWRQMIMDLPRSHAEIMARAIKDLLADTTSTLPALLDNQDQASLHFYFANFSHMRKELSPGLLKAYQSWDNDGDYNKLRAAVNQSAEHWFDIARHILKLYEQDNANCQQSIEALVTENKLGAPA